MNAKSSKKSKKKTAEKLFDIESKNRLSSDSIESFSEKPKLLKEYLDLSITNTFSELMFRLTPEKYTENKAVTLWNNIIKHR
jgi:hypothetical protein